MAILIKRYANRKLYNTETSRYITLKGIAKLLDEGEEVRVVDKETGEDITQVALSQILVGNQRAKESPSDTLLTQILSKGGDALYGALKKSVDDASDGLGDFQDRFRQFVKEGEELGRSLRWDSRGGSDDAAHEHRSPFARPDARPDARPGVPANGDEKAEGASGRDERAATAKSRSRLGGFPDVREAIQSAVGNALDLRDFGEFPRRRDFDALNKNLDRVADAIERLEATLREQNASDD